MQKLDNKAERAREHSHEARVIQELLEAAIAAQKLLRSLATRAQISAPLAVEIHDTERRLWCALYPEAAK